MGRGRRPRQRRGRKKRAGQHAPRGRQIEVSIDELEAARAHDGTFRGDVELRLLVGVYHVRSGRAALIGRALWPVDAPGAAPFRIDVDHGLVTARVFAASSQPTEGMFVVLVLALEEDSGRDVQSLYAQLEQPADWCVWDLGRSLPEPRSLAELAGLGPSEPPVPERVQLLFGADHVPARLESDELIGALLVRVPESRDPGPSDWRFHFQAPDGRNDWTAVLRIVVAGG
ncbi:MAG: hypothetical protein IT375_08400 [Polyangiaceae bacterium]|nr:hypothetical protein [Polyangiaceae bacterium]